MVTSVVLKTVIKNVLIRPAVGAPSFKKNSVLKTVELNIVIRHVVEALF